MTDLGEALQDGLQHGIAPLGELELDTSQGQVGTGALHVRKFRTVTLNRRNAGPAPDGRHRQSDRFGPRWKDGGRGNHKRDPD